MASYRNRISHTPVELAEAELEAVLDGAWVILNQEAQDTGETGKALEALRKKAEEATYIAWEADQMRKDHARQSGEAMQKALVAELENRFRSIKEKALRTFALGFQEKYLPDGPKKYNEEIKNSTVIVSVH